MASSNFGVPGELDDDGLNEAIEKARAEAGELSKISDNEITDEQIGDLEAAVAFISDAKQEQGTRAEAAQERAQKLADLRSAVDPDEDEDSEEENPEEETPEEAPTEEPVEAPAEDPEDDDEDEDDKNNGRPFSEETAETAEGEVEQASDTPGETIEVDGSINTDTLAGSQVTEDKEITEVAQNGKASLADAAKHNTTPDAVHEGRKVSLTAAANVPNVTPGQEFSSIGDARGVVNKALKALPTSGKGRTVNNALVFSVENEFSQKAGRDDLQVLLDAANEHRLEGGSLVAAGGWAAPSEQLLDFCSIEKADGLINLPSITVNRGGINYTKGPDFSSVLGSDSGFWDMTEAVAEAGTEEKTSLRPEVPGFTDVRLDAVGVMVEAGLLTRAGWPELVDRYVSLAVLAHQFKVHAKVVSEIESLVGSSIGVPNGFGNALDVLHGLDVVAAGERQRFAMGLNDTLEVLLPHWVKNVVRADLANRNGVDLLEITDARINAFFRARNINVQWLNHWQNLDVSGGVATAYPDTVRAIMYPAGTYVKGEEDVLTLDTVYDSVNLKKNDYVALFMEQGILVANPCYEGRHVSIPLAANGRTGAADITNDLFVAGGTAG